jgi:hypothetical protein
MNQSPNAPMTERRPTSMFQTWIEALTKPNEKTFADMAASPNAKATTAYLWVFIAAVIEIILSVIGQAPALRAALEQQGVGGNLPGGGLGFALIGALCGGPIGAVITVIFFAIGTALVQWVAKMFGGHGTHDQLAYTFAAIAAPVAVVSGLFTLLSAIPYVGFCFRILLGLIGLYVLVLEIMAAKGVNGFGYGQAAGSVVLPGLALGIVCCCVAFGISALVGASIGSIFSSINQSLVP